MSHNTGNFVHELVIMAKAFEELPKVQEELSTARSEIDRLQSQVQRLELKLIDRANEIDTIRATLAGVEAERDEATRAFLEADDKIAGFTRLIKDQAKAFGLLLEAVEPTPEPKLVTAEEALADPTSLNKPALQPEPEPVVSVPSDPTPVTADGGDGTSGQSDMGEPSAPSTIVSATAEDAAKPTATITAETSQPDPGPAIGSAFTLPPQEVNQVPVDPIATETDGASANAPTLNAEMPADANTTNESLGSTEDDVGYHNEPLISTEPGGWQAWDSWCTRMNRRYGGGSWPARPTTA